MSVLVITEIPLDISVYDQIAPGIEPHLRAAKGFTHHTAHAIGNGFVVTEIWDSSEDHKAFFETAIKPNLPVEPTRLEVHDLRNTISAP